MPSTKKIVNRLILITIIALAFIGVSYSNGTLIKHNEWTTGSKKIHYKLSPSIKTAIKNNSQEEGESILIRPFIESAETNYDNPQMIHTEVKSSFHMQVFGYSDSEPQFFEIRRQICIYPANDNPVDEINCFNSKDLLSVSDDMNNFNDIAISMYNLTPGSYIAEVTMSVEQVATLLNKSISYSAIGNNVYFVVKSKLNK